MRTTMAPLLSAFLCASLLIVNGCDKPAEEGSGDDANSAGGMAITAENTEITFVGSKPSGDSHEGGFKTVNGTINFDADNLDASSLNVVIDMTSIYTDSDRLTGHLSNQDFFEVNMYPEAKFTSTKFEHVEGDTYHIVGNLTIRDKTEEATLPATITTSDDGLTLAIDYPMPRSKFGITYGEGDINEEVPVSIKVEAKKS